MAMPRAIREFINEYEPAPYAVTDAEALLRMKKHAADLVSKAKKLTDESIQASAVFKTVCPHTQDVMAVDSKYIAGDYYNTSETHYQVKCTMCGSVLFSHIEYGKIHG